MTTSEKKAIEALRELRKFSEDLPAILPVYNKHNGDRIGYRIYADDWGQVVEKARLIQIVAANLHDAASVISKERAA